MDLVQDQQQHPTVHSSCEQGSNIEKQMKTAMGNYQAAAVNRFSPILHPPIFIIHGHLSQLLP